MSYIKLLLPLLAVLVTRGSCVVQTNSGPLQGKMVQAGKVEAFLGIPYAEPPVGSLRFLKPVSKKSWFEIFNATLLPPACIQLKTPSMIRFNVVMTEDCLFLNLWVPRSQSTIDPKTIMLFIHGGGYFGGSSNQAVFDGSKLANHGDVIVATINYRLGGLGFLTDFTDDAPGSMGLYDQVMAIKWIKDNAKHFNGDPENIVLFGESAGAFSVSLHQISPLSRNLFKRAILQSGSTINPIYDDNNEELKKIYKMYSDLTGCKYDNVTFVKSQKSVIDCLRKLPAEKFSEIDKEVFQKRLKRPVVRVGDDFLPESTIDAFQKGHFKHSEVLMGVTRDEGTAFLFGRRPELFGEFGEKDITSIFNKTTAFSFIRNSIQIDDSPALNKAIRRYIDDVNDDTKYTYVKAVSDALGDQIITCGNVFQAEYQSSRGDPVFFYMFDHRPSSSPFAEWIGVAHFDEVQFVFGNPLLNFTEYEKELSRDMMNMWVSFAKTGNPNVLGWLKYTYNHPNYLIIGKKDSVGLRPDHYRCDRWREVYRSVIDENLTQPLKQKC